MPFAGSSILQASQGVATNTFGQISSLAAATETTIVSYTVPVGQTFFLQLCEASGENIADYSVFVDGSRVALKRTYWGGSFNAEFSFDDSAGRGVLVEATKVVEVKVIHSSTMTGDFDARILGVLL